MDKIEGHSSVLGHMSLTASEHYLKYSQGFENAQPEAKPSVLSSIPLKLADCTEYKFSRNLPQIIKAWTTLANIDWHSPSCRVDIELIKANGTEALARLIPVALRDTNQSRHIAGFLLNLYNGERFHFDMADLGNIDHELFIDCISVLMTDFVPGPEIHDHFEKGNKIFEKLANDWGFKDYTKKI